MRESQRSKPSLQQPIDTIAENGGANKSDQDGSQPYQNAPSI